jgi:copper chaperone NosL
MVKPLWIAGLVMVVATAACRTTASGPPHIEADRSVCAYCGMLISEQLFAAAYRTSAGEARVFDDIGCLVASAKREPQPEAIRFWFHDASTGNWIDGKEATFVRVERRRTPMSGGFIAYRHAADAQGAAIEHHEHVIRGVSDLIGGGQ